LLGEIVIAVRLFLAFAAATAVVVVVISKVVVVDETKDAVVITVLISMSRGFKFGMEIMDVTDRN
jgi:hypothetical protein